MTDLRVGDRVRSRKKPGKLGKVVAIETGGPNVVVRWDNDPPERAESRDVLEKASPEPPNDLQ
jgi:hypothetical protein